MVWAAILLSPLSLQASIVTVTGADTGKDVTVKVNDVFTIELRQIAGTGYLWEFDELDGTFFEILTEEIKPNAQPGLVGGPSIKAWVIRAKRTGASVIRMLYFRPWEGKDKAAESFDLKVRIDR
jgi:predicted secreted protein